MKVLVAGHCCVDITPQLSTLSPGLEPGMLYPVGALRFDLGGSAPNTSAALIQLGHDVELAVAVGDDELGRVCRQLLSERDCVVHWIESDLASSYSIVVQHAEHDRTFWQHEGANASFDPRVLDLEGISPDILHLGYPSLLPLTCNDSAAVAATFTRARRLGITSSLDLAHVGDGSVASQVDWADWLRRTLPVTDVCSPSWDDVASALGLEGSPTPARLGEVAQQFVDWGAAVVTISAGSLGFALRTGSEARMKSAGRALARLSDTWADQALWFEADAVPTPKTTVGAGDTLSGGLLHGILSGLDPVEAGEKARTIVGRHLRQEPLCEQELVA